MTAEHVTPSGAAPRRGPIVYLVALVVVGMVVLAAALFVRSRHSAVTPAAEDCEKAKPKVEFAVAECDGGTAPATGAKGGAPAPAKH